MNKIELLVSLMKLDKAYTDTKKGLEEVLGDRCEILEAHFYKQKDDEGKEVKCIREIVLEYAGIPEDDCDKKTDEGYCRDGINDLYFSVVMPGTKSIYTFEQVAGKLIEVGETIKKWNIKELMKMDKLLGIKEDRTIQKKYDAKVYGDILMESFKFKWNGKRGHKENDRKEIFLIYIPGRKEWIKNAETCIMYLLVTHYMPLEHWQSAKRSKIVNYIRSVSLVPEEDIEKILKKQGLEQVKPL
ncbi:hypothetical protein ES705_21338 [subsurface metagenome]